jgi:outer membrane protein OmpA-like peptidoglycan-associated protein
MARLTPLSKGLITIVVLGAVGAGVYTKRDVLFPPKPHQDAAVPTKATLPGEGGGATATPTAAAPGATIPAITEGKPGCANLPEVRFYHWAWNAQMGLMLATGGKQAVEGSLMCKHGVNLKLVREDNVDQMQSLMLAFAEKLKAGEDNPSKGAHFVAIMGDGSAAFFKALNDALAKLGPEYTAVVVGSAGFSRGEDKFMGPQAWKDNPQAARGGMVSGYLRDGDWNIAMKWLGDNGIPNNPDESVYDPDALNWIPSSDYIDAAQKYVSGFCSDLKNVRTGKTEKRCVQGVVTWTPGDVTVAENKGGLVSIVSTKEYRSQMPNVIIGSKRWVQTHKELVKGMLRAIFEAGDQIKTDDAALRKAAAVSALVYGEKDPDYWYRFFTVRTVADKQGLNVELGGSSVNNLADNLYTFGLAPGSTNLFAATYQVFGGIVVQQYPKLVPSIYPVDKVVELTALKELQAEMGARAGTADLPTFNAATAASATTSVVSRKAWDIQFATGKADFTPRTAETLQLLLKDLVIAGGTTVEIHGHTDGVGSVDANMQLSENRAFAVAQWLKKNAPAAFPEGRVRVFAHGAQQPLAPNATPEGRARNRRVEIVLGTNL